MRSVLILLTTFTFLLACKQVPETESEKLFLELWEIFDKNYAFSSYEKAGVPVDVEVEITREGVDGRSGF